MEKISLKQGVNLWLIPDSKFKTCYSGIHIHTPLMRETVTENALIPLLVKQGSVKFPTREDISRKLDMLMGASLVCAAQKRGEEQLLSFSLSSISNRFSPSEDVFKEGLSLLFDVVFNPVISKENIKTEKENLSDIIESEKNDKRTYAGIRCRQEMCKNDAYAVSENGYTEDFSQIDESSLKKRHRELAENSVIDIVICGNFNIEDAKACAFELSSFLKDRSDERPETIPAKSGEIRTVTEEMAVSQGKLCIGFTTPNVPADDKDYPAMLLYNSIFGGGAHSKLFLNVREKLSLAYYAGSSYERAKSIIVVSSGIESKNFEPAKNEIFAQYEEMVNGNISEAEIDVSKKSLINSFKSSKDSVKGFAAFNLGQIMSGSLFTVEEIIEAIEKIQIEDIVRVSQKVKPSLIYFLKGADR